VYDAFEGGWATSITAYPGRNGHVVPFGSATATTLFAVSQWTDDADPEFDYGAIRISSPLGDAAGWLGYGVKHDDAALLGARVRIFGYPSDKPLGTMWGMAKRLKGVEKHKLFYKADTFGGQSGSPIFGKLSNACRPCAFGVHAYGVGLEPFATSNSGTRVDATVFASLAFWATQ
jgi:glutamyl endopeptidase